MSSLEQRQAMARAMLAATPLEELNALLVTANTMVEKGENYLRGLKQEVDGYRLTREYINEELFKRFAAKGDLPAAWEPPKDE